MVWTPKFVCVCFFLWGPFPGDESGCIDSGEGIVEFHKEFQHRTISALIKRRERVPSFRLFRKREHGFDAKLDGQNPASQKFTWHVVKQLKLVGVVWCCVSYTFMLNEHGWSISVSNIPAMQVTCIRIVSIFAEGSIHNVQRFRWFRILIKRWLSATWPIIRMVGGLVGWLWREKHPESVPRIGWSSKMCWFR